MMEGKWSQEMYHRLQIILFKFDIYTNSIKKNVYKFFLLYVFKEIESWDFDSLHLDWKRCMPLKRAKINVA